jgi:DNA-directed RNA polymerase specialized sigma24 family protein
MGTSTHMEAPFPGVRRVQERTGLPGVPMSDYERYVAARAVALRRTAYLLCGDWDRAEDLVRRTLVGLHSAWQAAGTGDVTDAEARRLLLRSWAGEPPFAEPAPAGRRPGLGQALHGVLLGMPDRRRVVVVLRFWEALPEAGVAALLGAPAAVVRAEGEAGLAQLRGLVGEVPAPGGDADAPEAARLLLSVVVEGEPAMRLRAEEVVAAIEAD